MLGAGGNLIQSIVDVVHVAIGSSAVVESITRDVVPYDVLFINDTLRSSP